MPRFRGTKNTREVLIVKESGEEAKFIIGQKEFEIDGRKYTSDVAPELDNDRTFVPIRVISEQLFNKEVFWDDGIIVISDTEIYLIPLVMKIIR